MAATSAGWIPPAPTGGLDTSCRAHHADSAPHHVGRTSHAEGRLELLPRCRIRTAITHAAATAATRIQPFTLHLQFTPTSGEP